MGGDGLGEGKGERDEGGDNVQVDDSCAQRKGKRCGGSVAGGRGGEDSLTLLTSRALRRSWLSQEQAR